MFAQQMNKLSIFLIRLIEFLRLFLPLDIFNLTKLGKDLLAA